MKRPAQSRRLPKAAPALDAQWVAEHLPGLPIGVRQWVAQQPSLVTFLMARQDGIADRCLSAQRLEDLARAWSASLPLQRGATVYRFVDFAQQLELDLGGPPEPRRRSLYRRRVRPSRGNVS
jgi:hypothetical protein